MTIPEASAKAVGVVPAAIMRGAGFLLLWLVIIGAGTSDLAVGLVSAAAASWASLRLLPPGPGHVRDHGVDFAGDSHLPPGAHRVRFRLRPRSPKLQPARNEAD
ncbi:MAG: hypothetical protein ACREIR_05230, partial [Geminicoccaceae bacterium]